MVHMNFMINHMWHMICLKNYRARIGVQVDSKIESFFQKYSLCVSLCPSLEPKGLSFVRIRRKFQSFLWVIVRWNIWCPIKRNQTLEHQNRNEL